MIFMENGTIRFVPNNIKMIKLFHYNALVSVETDCLSYLSQ